MAEGLTSLLRMLEEEEEEDRDTLKSSSLENQLQPLVVDSSWLPLYKEEVLKEAVDDIVGFVTNPDMGIRQHAEEASKFLNCVCVLCACANALGMMEGMEIFCQGYKVLDNIEVVLKEDSSFQLTTEVKHLSMQAITQLSTVGTLLEGKEKILLELCFSSVFWLPPAEHIVSPKPTLYYEVLMSMDTLLQQVVANCSESRVSEVLEMIFQLLINFSNCERPEVRKRAVGRIRGLSRFLTASSWGKHDQKTENQEFQIPNFGELLGQLVLLLSFKEKEEDTSAMALDALWCFFIEKHQKCTTLPEDHEELRQDWEVQTAAPSCSEVARTVTESPVST